MPTPDRVLLDTHVLLWWKAVSDRLSPAVVQLLRDRPEILISPVTCWEVAMLVAKKRVRLDRPTEAWVRDVLADRVELAELTPAIAVAAAELPDFHGDPADRFLVATARSAGVPLVSIDRRIRAYAAERPGLAVLW